MSIIKKRVRKLNDEEIGSGPVAYWMSRDQRVKDNWALIFSQEISNNNEVIVVFNLVPQFSEAALRQYNFMLEGLKEVEENLKEKNIPFYIFTGKPANNIVKFLNNNKVSALVTDFDPLKIKEKWKETLQPELDIAFYEVDAHNIVPCWAASQKQEYAAYTIRPKLKKLLPEFLTDFPGVKKQNRKNQSSINWDKLYDSLKINNEIKPVDWLKPGNEEAFEKLEEFLQNKLDNYPDYNNDPNKNVLSNMSPYLHFGQISAQRIALLVKDSAVSGEAKEDYLEELIIRRELADNFCFYNKNYDNVGGFPDWAKKTIQEHKNDKRQYVYSREELEKAKTHDPLWNAAQKEMVTRGKMHGYMRMYWAKKILEWTPDVETAFEIALYLNDKYELDGRDPNGYVGVAWSMGGVHDRAWQERKIFGKIRYMSYNGCKRKFDIEKYIKKYEQ